MLLQTCKHFGLEQAGGSAPVDLEFVGIPQREPSLQPDTVLSDSVTRDGAATRSYHEVRFGEQLCRRESWVCKAIEHGTQGVSG
jgi:hypothetical protein